MWDAPGHQGGEAYRRHPVGAEFYRLFGEGILRADLGISVPDLGDWLEHVGVPGESERRAARVFGADWTFYVVVGTSGSNRIIVNGVVAQDEIVLADRNCHKSLDHAFTLSGARPAYLMPSRNGYGMIGLIPPGRLTPEHVKQLIESSPLAQGRSLARARVRRDHQQHLRRPVLRRRARREDARPGRAQTALRRGLVRLRPLPSDVSEPVCHGRGRCTTRSGRCSLRRTRPTRCCRRCRWHR